MFTFKEFPGRIDFMETLNDRRAQNRRAGPDAALDSTKWQAFRHELRRLLSMDSDFVRKRFFDHRNFTVLMLAIYGIAGPFLWIWDYVTDPIGAQGTILLRLLFLSCFAMSAAFILYSNVLVLSLVSYLWILICETDFVLIANRLDGGMTYGIGGFMFFMLASIVFSQCFPLFLNLTMAFSLALLPHLLGIAGIAHSFQHANYAVLIWPATFVVLFMQFFITQNYLRRYDLERQLELAANTDPMTGASNRRHFMNLFSQEITRVRRTGQCLSLLMLDIDHFKKVNDTYGHPTGDEVIRKVADICRVGSREVDIVARLGGEEFAVLLPGTDEQGAIAVAERIRALIEGTTVPTPVNSALHFTASLGVAKLALDEPDQEALMARADAALYQAKMTGRNRVAYIPNKERRLDIAISHVEGARALAELPNLTPRIL
jgi:diguanylate cyclase (GGDEF)-like protein